MDHRADNETFPAPKLAANSLSANGTTGEECFLASRLIRKSQLIRHLDTALTSQLRLKPDLHQR